MISRKGSIRNGYLTKVYARVLNYTCAHPECKNGKDIEVHHIRPLKKGGADKFWNLISLCWSCHHTKKLHSQSEEKLAELYVYKVYHELGILGFEMDEFQEGFAEKYKKMLRDKKLEEDKNATLALDDVLSTTPLPPSTDERGEVINPS